MDTLKMKLGDHPTDAYTELRDEDDARISSARAALALFVDADPEWIDAAIALLKALNTRYYLQH